MRKKARGMFCGSVSLTQEQIDFLDDISKCCRYSGGRKLSKTGIIRALLCALERLDVNAENVKSEKELKNRIIETFCKTR